MTITLPWPPSGLSPNARLHWAKVSRLKRQYRAACALQARVQGAKRVQAQRLHVHVTFVPPNRIRRDWDNLIASMKSGFDGLVDVLGVDDSKWVVSHEIDHTRVGGFVTVQVHPCHA